MAQSKRPKITARDLVQLLATKHRADVFVAECKTGPTHGALMQRMDAWTMARSWRHPLVTAYEIKVARQDWLDDAKWRGYLPYCNEFMFCAPPGVIEVNELPEQAGLLVCSVNATRLYRKKRAPYRDVVIPGEIFRYILFSRVQVARHAYEADGDESSGAEFWRTWLASKRELQDLGRHVSKALHKRLSEEILDRDYKQRRLEKDLAAMGDIRTSLSRLGFNDGAVPAEWAIKRRVEELQAGVPRGLNRAIEAAERAIERIREAAKL